MFKTRSFKTSASEIKSTLCLHFIMLMVRMMQKSTISCLMKKECPSLKLSELIANQVSTSDHIPVYIIL